MATQNTDAAAAAPPAWRANGRGLRALGACGGAHIIHDGIVSLVYVLLPVWVGSFAITLAQAAMLKAVYSLAMSIFQVPAGILAERIGERTVLSAGTVLAGIGFLLMGSAGSYPVLLLVLMLAGLGSAVQHPLGSSLVAAAFDPGRRRSALGIYNFTGDLGKMALPGLAALSLAAYPWQVTTNGVGMLCLAGALGLVLALRPTRGAREPVAEPAEATSCAPVARGWGIIDPVGFTALSTVGVMDSAVRSGTLVLLPFLLLDKGASLGSVGLAFTLVFAGGACGKFACGFIADRIGIVRTVLATELCTAAGIVLLATLPLAGIFILLPLFGVALNGTSSVLYGTVADFVAPERQARVFALFYTIVLGSSAAATVGFGALGDFASISTACYMMAALVLLVLPACIWLRE